MITEILGNPTTSEINRLLGHRQEVSYDLKEDQFLPLGDNSPASSDAR